LRTYADRELRSFEFLTLGNGRFGQGTLNSALYELYKQELIVRTKDPGSDAAWWAISAKGLALPAAKAKK